MKWNPINGADDHPSESGWYLVTGDSDEGLYVEPVLWDSGRWGMVLDGALGILHHRHSEFLAWAELPEPYQEPRVVELDIDDVVHQPRKEGS